MPGCSKCNGKTFILEIEDGEEVWVPCSCRVEKDTENMLLVRLHDAQIPRSFVNYTLDSYKAIAIRHRDKKANVVAIQTLECYIADPKEFLNNYRVLWIWGEDANAGHTTFAIIFGIALMDCGYRVRFLEMQDIIDRFTKFETKEQFFEELQDYDVFIIDDAFDRTRVTIKSEYNRVQLFQFINNVYNNGKHFIMTSNVPMKDIVTKNDSAFAQCQSVLLRSVHSLEIRGSLIEPLSETEEKPVVKKGITREPI